MRFLLALMLMVPAFAQQADPPAKAGGKTAQTPAAADAQTAQTPANPDAPTAQPPAKTDAQPVQTPAATDAPTAQTPAQTDAQTAQQPAKTDAQPAQTPAAADAQTPPQPAKTNAQPAQTPAPADAQIPQTPAKTEQAAAPSPAPSGEEWFTGSVDLGYRWLTGVNGNFPEYRSVVNLGQGLILNGLDFTITDPKKRLFDRVDASAYGWGGDPYTTARLNARKQGDYDFFFDYRNIAYFDAVPSYANPTAPAGFNEQSFDTHRRSMTIGLDLRPGKRIVPYLVYDRNSGYGNGVDEWVQDSNDEFAVPTLLRDSTNNYRGGVRFEYNRFHITLEQGGTTYKDDDQSTWSGTNDGDRTSPIFGQTLSLTSLHQAYDVTGKSLYSKALVTAHPFSWIDIYGQFLYSDPKTTVNFSETAAGNYLMIQELLFYASQQSIGTGAANQPHTTGTVGFEIRPFKRMRIIQNWMTDRYHDASFGMMNITPTLATGGGITSLNPLQIVNYNQEQVDVLYDVGSKLTLRAGYRYIWGEATTTASPFFDPAGAEEQGQLKRNIALAGLNFRASEKLSFNLDYEGGTADAVYFRDSLNTYQKARARAKYRLLPSLLLQAHVSLLNNSNPASSIQYNFLSRDNSLAVYWTPKSAKRIAVTGEYDRSTMHSTINYLTLPFLTTADSDYRDNAHSVTGLVDVSLPGRVAAKLSMGGSMFLSNGSNTTRFYQPIARLSLPIGKHVSWNTEWKYYGYQENFYLFESFRTHTFMTGLKITR